MLTLLFMICLFSVFGRLFMLSIRGAWGLTKVLFTLVFFPVILIGMAFANLAAFAIPILLLAGAVSLLVPKY